MPITLVADVIFKMPSDSAKPLIQQKIAWLIASMGYGTSLMYWEPLLVGFVRRAPASRIYTNKNKVPSAGTYLPLEPVLRHVIVNKPKKKGARYLTKMLVPNPDIIYHIVRYRPRIVIVTEFGICTLYGLLAARLCRPCQTILLVEGDPTPTLGRTRGWRLQLRRWIARASDLLIANNASAADYLRDTLHVPEHKLLKAVYLVSAPGHNTRPVAAPSVAPQREVPSTRACVFLFVGRIIECKGLEYLVRACALIPDSVRLNFIVWIVGDGDKRGDLEKLVKEHGVQDNFRLFGKQPYEELADFYRNADVFVFPTLNDYGGMVSFEALSYGMPLLLSQYAGASKDIVAPGKNGFVFDPYDLSAFAERLTWCIQHRNQLTGFRAQSLQIAKRYTVDEAVDNLVGAIGTCLTNNSRAH